MEKVYATDDVSVYWYSERCIHSAICVKSLPAVFKPKERPWIDVHAAPPETIRKAVLSCPSKALSLEPQLIHEDALPNRKRPLPEVKLHPDGPLEVSGDLRIVEEGISTELIGKTYFCRCGGSANKPYCDGSHLRNGFHG
ncbi:MAG: (4Fe-4S)-binding protein [Bacteroidia bacterium]